MTASMISTNDTFIDLIEPWMLIKYENIFNLLKWPMNLPKMPIVKKMECGLKRSFNDQQWQTKEATNILFGIPTRTRNWIHLELIIFYFYELKDESAPTNNKRRRKKTQVICK